MLTSSVSCLRKRCLYNGCLERTKWIPSAPYSTAVASNRDDTAVKRYRPSAAQLATDGDESHIRARRLGDYHVVARQRPSDTPTSALTVAQRHASRELKYLADPLKLANRVRDMLRHGDHIKSTELVRQASREMACVVGWNHIIDHHMQRRAIKEAFSVYNEMKKRGQFPDSYTITILLRALSIPPHRPDNLARAITLYHSLNAPNSRVKKALTHTNAVLKVCAAHDDMDALWGIVATVPDRGPLAADAITYSTILSAIRSHVIANTTLESSSRSADDQELQLRGQAIEDGKTLWKEIMKRSSQGSVRVDEELVNTMGRLLCLGLRPRDWDDALSLVKQTTGVPRQIPTYGTENRDASLLDGHRARERESGHVIEDVTSADDAREFEVVESDSSSTGLLVQPGVKILSLVLEACRKMRAHKAARAYWKTLTVDYAVKPDLENYHCYLRVLRQSRASAHALEVIRELKSFLQPMSKTFRIAMSVCVRDANNRHAPTHANELLQLMLDSKHGFDQIAMQNCAQLVIDSRSIDAMTETYHLLQRHAQYANADDHKSTLNSCQDVVDAILRDPSIDHTDTKAWRARRKEISDLGYGLQEQSHDRGRDKPRTSSRHEAYNSARRDDASRTRRTPS